MIMDLSVVGFILHIPASVMKALNRIRKIG